MSNVASSATPVAIDLQDLLAPISAEHPSGESLRYEGFYDSVQELKREDDPTLPQGVWKRDLKRAEWGRVLNMCSEALATRTKDLQVAIWFTRAGIYQHGFPGAELGFRLIAGLCEDFWDDLHPQLEEGDDISFRLGPLDWLNDHLVEDLKQIAITHPEADDALAYCWSDWESAMHYRDSRGPRWQGRNGPPRRTA